MRSDCHDFFSLHPQIQVALKTSTHQDNEGAKLSSNESKMSMKTHIYNNAQYRGIKLRSMTNNLKKESASKY